MKNQDDLITVYTIYNSSKYNDYESCYKEMDKLYHMVKNYIKRNGYNDASFIIGISNTDSKTAKVNYIKTGKKGRPKRIINGKKIDWHIHLYVACDNLSVSIFSNKLRIYLQSKKKINFIQKKNTLNVSLPYIEKQCQYIRKFGNAFK